MTLRLCSLIPFVFSQGLLFSQITIQPCQPNQCTGSVTFQVPQPNGSMATFTDSGFALFTVPQTDGTVRHYVGVQTTPELVNLQAWSALTAPTAAAPPVTPPSVPAASQPSATSAAFVKVDSLTQGNWQGVYGASGYNIIDAKTAYPAFATVTPIRATLNDYVWSASVGDARALASPTGRIASCWYSSTDMELDLQLTGMHQLALYVLDWDSTERSEVVTISDGVTGAILDLRSVSSFHNGLYLVWKVSGHVTITVTRTGWANAVLSGIFFD